MEKTILPGALHGTVAAPASKSELHRALICAALCGGETEIECPEPPADVLATAEGLRQLGAGMEYRNEKYYVNQIRPQHSATVDCGESGSTLRFLLPLAAALGTETEFLCRGRLAERPIRPLLDALNAFGCVAEPTPGGFSLQGKLHPGNYLLDASASSQFLTGLLLALPLLPGSSITVSGPIASMNYVNLTTCTASRFGVEICCRDGEYTAVGSYASPWTYAPEGDWSAAAYWLVAAAMGSDLTVEGLCPDSVQGDRAVAELIERVRLGGAVIDAEPVPDLVPPLAVLAAVTPGETCFVHAARLRQKESDRLAALAALLNGLGGRCTETADGLAICGVPSLKGGEADSFGDHRIAMAAAVAATVCESPVLLRGAESTAKSYPAFWRDFESLGGKMK